MILESKYLDNFTYKSEQNFYMEIYNSHIKIITPDGTIKRNDYFDTIIIKDTYFMLRISKFNMGIISFLPHDKELRNCLISYHLYKKRKSILLDFLVN